MVVLLLFVVMVFVSKRVTDVVCPFYRPTRKFTVPFCDNLVSGVPSCVVDKFYPDLSQEEMVARLEAGLDSLPELGICRHFVRSDVWHSSFPSAKSKCFFGGSCVHPTVSGYGACSVNCSRFKSSV